jgi:4,5-dihydroxyphthalate decarboxylase
MSKLQLSMAMGSNERSRPVIDGRVQPDGIDLMSSALHGSEIFWRQLHFQDFDISEMSLSSLLIATAQGNRDWVGVPVFTSRQFFHTGIWVRTESGIREPADLKGKRVGVPEYQQTAALWARGVLKHEFGVDATDLEWFMERTPERSHGGATGFQPPAGVKLNRIPAEKNIGAMMMSGELDATLLYLTDPNLVDRSRVVFEGNPHVQYLFPDRTAEGKRYFRKTGIFPINHGMVVRRSVYEQHPWVALNIFNAFRQAKEQVATQTRQLVSTHVQLGLVPDGTAEGLQQDTYPYGVKSNQKVLETVCQYSHEQGLTPRVLGLDEIFAPSTLDL